MIASKPQEAETEDRGPRRMLNEAKVLEIVPFSRSTLHRLIKQGLFPQPVHVSPNRTAWFLDTIIGWQRAISECDPHFNPNRRRGKGRRHRGPPSPT